VITVARRWWRLSAFALTSVAAFAFAVVLMAARRPETLDDAAIVLVYARHLSGGGGIYWNASDGRVDGYTSFLDMVVKAAVIALTHADPLTAAHALSLVFLGVSVLAGAAIAFRSSAGSSPAGMFVAGLGAFAFGANRSLANGASFLLETSLHAGVALVALYIVCFAPLERRPWRVVLAASWVLLVLVRPEGGPIAVLQACAFVYVYRRRLPPRVLAQPCVALVGAIATYYGWHLAYFGWLAPNTYYAKASDSRWLEIQDGAHYVAESLRGSRATCLLVALPACALVPRTWSGTDARMRFGIAGLSGLASISEVVLSGGDGYPGGRFLAVPVAYLLAGAAVGAARMRSLWRAAAIVPLALLVYEEKESLRWRERIVAERLASWPYSLRSIHCAAEAERVLASHVRSMAQTDEQVFKLLDDDLRVIDLTGINDVSIAHAKWPGRNLWGKANVTPEWIRDGAEALMLGPKTDYSRPWARYTTEELVGETEGSEPFGVGLSRDARAALIERYVPLSVPACGMFLNVLVRADRAELFRGGSVLLGASSNTP
jgi:hypothetical protein